MATRDELCTEEEVTTLVYSFYDRVRADEALGPIFNGHIQDWDKHLKRMVQFWSSMLRGTGTYSGTPMPVHVALPDLSAELFQQWLKLFHLTCETLPNRPFAEKAEDFAHRIARSLWYGYQLYNKPEAAPTEVFNA
ncbi:MAG TPA: group III truncated hemoglobin [Eoetvoesiella sp.]|uniref:group III truncated hemoglobin n=1 Tax=Eoetvoesiella sp. TaxID=1966355 RepID=UPI002BBB77E1|nr:group III truncated hemoglobin [Eoetvoesiella sp.]HWK60901.1 group III truncated hemoglobin [Eoetvoesiella sp.]